MTLIFYYLCIKINNMKEYIKKLKLLYDGEFPKKEIDCRYETYEEWLERKLYNIQKLIIEKKKI